MLSIWRQKRRQHVHRWTLANVRMEIIFFYTVGVFFLKKHEPKLGKLVFSCFTYAVQKEEMLSIKSYLRNWCLLQLTIGRDDNGHSESRFSYGIL
jgi:hypothetical protein